MAQGTPLSSIYVFTRKPWRCPDCNVIHRGECPNKVLITVHELEHRVGIVEDELMAHSRHMEELQPFLERLNARVTEMSKAIKKIRKEMRQWREGGRRTNKRRS